ncbi:hypothetical protein EVAR_19647_1 [Eumeta japonica]|uniref:Uncharacterized protein n=1 Tax=Eumeta variegata TaxID=151549 RepID=A0A4C1V375_EUMVA|nr:hypothetical protein EVAR_19647_1 [Eumeta japonica]
MGTKEYCKRERDRRVPTVYNELEFCPALEPHDRIGKIPNFLASSTGARGRALLERRDLTHDRSLPQGMYEVRACKLRERPASATRISEYPGRFPEQDTIRH